MMISTTVFWLMMAFGLNKLLDFGVWRYFAAVLTTLAFSSIIIVYGLLSGHLFQSDIVNMSVGGVVLLLNWGVVGFLYVTKRLGFAGIKPS
jgi:hypothetical protein